MTYNNNNDNINSSPSLSVTFSEYLFSIEVCLHNIDNSDNNMQIAEQRYNVLAAYFNY